MVLLLVLGVVTVLIFLVIVLVLFMMISRFMIAFPDFFDPYEVVGDQLTLF